MKTISCIILTILLSGITIQRVSAAAQEQEDLFNHFRNSQTVCLVVNQTFGDADAGKINLPFQYVAQKLLESTGLKVFLPNTNNCDFRLIIQARGEAKGIPYSDGKIHYTFASISGTILFQHTKGYTYEKSFRSNSGFAQYIPGSDDRLSPSSAPFLEAFKLTLCDLPDRWETRRDSFQRVLIQMIKEIYGLTPLLNVIRNHSPAEDYHLGLCSTLRTRGG